jgi:hypothetical protein
VAALSAMVSTPEAAPFVVGENTTLTVQLVPAASVAPHVVLETANGPLVVMPPNVRSLLRRLVIVTVLALLVVPTVTVPKLRLLDETVTGAVPVPVSVTVCGLVSALSVTTRLPAAALRAVGTNCTLIVQLAPAASDAPHVVAETTNGPPVERPLMPSAVFRRLVTVTLRALLVLPTATDPNEMLLDDSVTGALPLPVSAIVCVPASSVTVMAPAAAPTTVGANVT